MITNNEVTIYHKGYDELLRTSNWKRHNYDNVWLFENQGVEVNQGLTNSNKVEVRIWYDLNEGLNIDDISVGDIIVKGHLNEEIETQKDLSNYDIYIVSSITNNIYGKSKHIHLGGQ